MGKIKNFLARNRKWVIIILIITIIIVYLISRNNKEESVPQTSIPSPTPTNFQVDQSKNSNGQFYYINQIVTNKTPITGFSWRNEKNIYSTNTGVYEAGTNTPIVEAPISDIRWADSFNSLIKISNRWSKLNFDSKELLLIPLSLNNPIISHDGQKIADMLNTNLLVYSTDDYSKKEVKFNEPVTNIFFVKNTEDIVVLTSYAKRTYIYKVDTNLNIKSEFELEDELLAESVSDNGEYLLLTLGNKLILYNFNNTTTEYEFLDKSQLKANFRNSNEFVVVEKYNDNLNRELDNVYLLTTNRKKSFIIDSKELKNRINIDIPIAFSNSGNIVSFTENAGKTWILSLKPNLYPTYSNAGELIYSNIEPRSH